MLPIQTAKPDAAEFKMGVVFARLLCATANYCFIKESMKKIIQRPHGFNKGNEFDECPTITKSSFEENNVVCDTSAVNRVVSITKTACMPNGSGTDYTKYVYLTVRFKDGQEAKLRLSCWYDTLNYMFAQVYDKLGELPNPEEAHAMLAEAIKDMVAFTPFTELDGQYRRPKYQSYPNLPELPSELKGKKFRIRKLTPRECFRLMGVDDTDIDKIQAAGISNSAQYKLAGNSIVVDVLFHLFRKMFIETEPDYEKGKTLSLW